MERIRVSSGRGFGDFSIAAAQEEVSEDGQK